MRGQFLLRRIAQPARGCELGAHCDGCRWGLLDGHCTDSDCDRDTDRNSDGHLLFHANVHSDIFIIGHTDPDTDLLSNTIEVVKLTSLASVVALPELLYAADMARSVSYNASPIVMAAAPLSTKACTSLPSSRSSPPDQLG